MLSQRNVAGANMHSQYRRGLVGLSQQSLSSCCAARRLSVRPTLLDVHRSGFPPSGGNTGVEPPCGASDSLVFLGSLRLAVSAIVSCGGVSQEHLLGAICQTADQIPTAAARRRYGIWVQANWTKLMACRRPRSRNAQQTCCPSPPRRTLGCQARHNRGVTGSPPASGPAAVTARAT
jgi:hypothetical protein